jgi:hypothetical protein
LETSVADLGDAGEAMAGQLPAQLSGGRLGKRCLMLLEGGIATIVGLGLPLVLAWWLLQPTS